MSETPSPSDPILRHRVLVTGGAGFIGGHVVDRLLSDGHFVVVVDSLHPQVHPYIEAIDTRRPLWVREQLRDYPMRFIFIHADICDRGAMFDRLSVYQIDTVIHLAARVGVGQAEHEIFDYVNVNAGGTAAVLDAIANVNRVTMDRAGVKMVTRLIVASSMSCYGEGAYYSEVKDDERYDVQPRTVEDIRRVGWEVHRNGEALTPVLTHESKPLDPQGIYAESKATTERMSLLFGEHHGVPTTACRFFNVYGPRQSLRNPYTGVIAIFMGAVLRGERPKVYEDGGQTRDFINVFDVSRAVVKLIDSPHTGPLNIGTGEDTSIGEVAAMVCDTDPQQRGIAPEVTGQFRSGDIRHCIADPRSGVAAGVIGDINEPPGSEVYPRWVDGHSGPVVNLDMTALRDGIAALWGWSADQNADIDADPAADLERFGLISTVKS